MKTIVIVGAGALGSHLVQFSRNFDARIVVADDDKVEHKNTKSQFHSTNFIRLNKASALMRLMHHEFGVTVAVIDKRIEPRRTFLLDQADIVVDCTDNRESRQLIAEHCRDNDIVCLHGGISASGDYARIVWDSHWSDEVEDDPGAPTCEDGEFLPMIGVASTRMAAELQRYLKTGEQRSYAVGLDFLQRIA